MSLTEEARAEVRHAGGQCPINLLDEQTKEEVLAALAVVNAAAVSRALAKRGVHIKAASLTYHLRRDCACPR